VIGDTSSRVTGFMEALLSNLRKTAEFSGGMLPNHLSGIVPLNKPKPGKNASVLNILY
jgi:hypothetical protein